MTDEGVVPYLLFGGGGIHWRVEGHVLNAVVVKQLRWRPGEQQLLWVITFYWLWILVPTVDDPVINKVRKTPELPCVSSV